MQDMDDDDDFLDFEDELEKEDEKPSKPAAKEEADDGDIEVEVVDDTPPADKGKWVADDDKDGPPDEPTEDEIKSYSKSVQERIKKLTARMHAERRAKEQLAREHEEALRFANQYLHENNQLKDIVESGEKVLIGEQSARLDATLEKARSDWRKAHEAGDEEGMLAAQEKIAGITAQKQTLLQRRVQPLPRQAPPTRQPQPSAETLSWTERNPWFGKDEPMTAFAHAVHRDLVLNKGVQVETPDYWRALDNEIRKRFPERFGNEKPAPEPEKRRRVPVAGAQRSSATASQSRKVTLTEGQVRLARKLGLTNEQYATELMRLEKAND